MIFPCNVAETQYKGMITQSSHNRNQRARGLMHKLAITRAALCMAVRKSILGMQLYQEHTAFSDNIRHVQKLQLLQWRFAEISYPDIAAFYNTAYIAAKKQNWKSYQFHFLLTPAPYPISFDTADCAGQIQNPRLNASACNHLELRARCFRWLYFHY